MNSYKLKLTALSPIHIGTGEVYEPTNFVIDGGYLYEFDEVEFYKSLNEEQKENINNLMENWLDLLDFYRSNIESAKALAFAKYPTTKEVENKYQNLINKDGTRNTNQFHIYKTFKNPNSHQAIIPASSIKGMLDTVFQIYPPKSSNEIRQKLILSDATMLEGGVEIGYSYRVHKKPNKEAKNKIPQIVEVIKPNSTFECTIKTEYSFDKIKEMMKSYYEKRDNSRYKEDAYSFVARVGKYSGKGYMVDDIKNATNSYEKPIATHTVYENIRLPFGWIKIEDSITQKRVEDAKIAEEQNRLDALSPFEKIMEYFDNDVVKLVQAMEKGAIENFEDIKKELAQETKKELQKTPKNWDKAKKKALNRKKYIEGLLNG